MYRKLFLPETAGEDHNNRQDFQASQQHGKRAYPFGSIGERLKTSGRADDVADARSGVGYTSDNTAESGCQIQSGQSQQQTENDYAENERRNKNKYRIDNAAVDR